MKTQTQAKAQVKSRYKPNSGWLSVQLPLETDAKLREIAEKTGLKLTTIVKMGIDHQYREWELAGFRMVGAVQPAKMEVVQ